MTSDVAQAAPDVSHKPLPGVVPRPFLPKLIRGVSRRLAKRIETFAARRSLRASGLRGVDKISTFTTPDELAALLDLAMHCPPGAAALEIGSYLGASACYIAAGLAHVGGMLTCIDTWQNETMPEGERDTFAEFQRNVAAVRHRLILIRKPTEELTTAELGGPFHLVFIDGDHSYAAARRDFDLVAPAVAPKGIVAFHDVRAYPDVTRVVGEVMATGEWEPVSIVSNLMWLRRRP
jgi:predicted O-methyltransferase YrrM